MAKTRTRRMTRKVLGVGINDLRWSHGAASKQPAEHQVVYRVWRAMLQQCYDPHFLERNPSFKKANLSVCERWLTLSNFAADIEDLPGYDQWYCEAIDNLNCGYNTMSLSVTGHVYQPESACFRKRSTHSRKHDGE